MSRTWQEENSLEDFVAYFMQAAEENDGEMLRNIISKMNELGYDKEAQDLLGDYSIV